jgi:hypothetical protein
MSPSHIWPPQAPPHTLALPHPNRYANLRVGTSLLSFPRVVPTSVPSPRMHTHANPLAGSSILGINCLPVLRKRMMHATMLQSMPGIALHKSSGPSPSPTLPPLRGILPTGRPLAVNHHLAPSAYRCGLLRSFIQPSEPSWNTYARLQMMKHSPRGTEQRQMNVDA